MHPAVRDTAQDYVVWHVEVDDEAEGCALRATYGHQYNGFSNITTGLARQETDCRCASRSFPCPSVRGKPSRIQCYKKGTAQCTDFASSYTLPLTLFCNASSLLVTTLSMTSSGRRPPDATIDSASRPTSVLDTTTVTFSTCCSCTWLRWGNALLCNMLPEEVSGRHRHDIVLLHEPPRERALSCTGLACTTNQNVSAPQAQGDLHS